MVALIHPTHTFPAQGAAPQAAVTRPRHLRLVESKTKAADPLSMVAVVAVVATLLLVVLVRGVQGAPPAADWQGLIESSAASSSVSVNAASGDTTVTVVDGDSWASIAARVAPGTDPVEFARSLASSNGGYQLQVGQVLLVPASN